MEPVGNSLNFSLPSLCITAGTQNHCTCNASLTINLQTVFFCLSNPITSKVKGHLWHYGFHPVRANTKQLNLHMACSRDAGRVLQYACIGPRHLKPLLTLQTSILGHIFLSQQNEESLLAFSISSQLSSENGKEFSLPTVQFTPGCWTKVCSLYTHHFTKKKGGKKWIPSTLLASAVQKVEEENPTLMQMLMQDLEGHHR